HGALLGKPETQAETADPDLVEGIGPDDAKAERYGKPDDEKHDDDPQVTDPVDTVRIGMFLHDYCSMICSSSAIMRFFFERSMPMASVMSIRAYRSRQTTMPRLIIWSISCRDMDLSRVTGMRLVRPIISIRLRSP